MLKPQTHRYANDLSRPAFLSRGTSAEHGVGKLTLFVFAVLAGIVIYGLSQVGPIFYSYLELQNQMQQAARVASVKNDEELRKLIAPHIRDLQIPATIEDLVIERFEDYIYIGMSYSETLTIPLGEKDIQIYTFQFNPYAEEDL